MITPPIFMQVIYKNERRGESVLVTCPANWGSCIAIDVERAMQKPTLNMFIATKGKSTYPT